MLSVNALEFLTHPKRKTVHDLSTFSPYEFDLPADRTRSFLERGVSILPGESEKTVGGPLRETAV